MVDLFLNIIFFILAGPGLIIDLHGQRHGQNSTGRDHTSQTNQ